jgi:hypothetical protein
LTIDNFFAGLRPEAPNQDRSDLLAARDQGQKTIADLDAAIGVLDAGPAQLENFAITVMRGAATKIVTGTQNIADAVKLVQAAPTTVTSATPASATGRARGRAIPRPQVSVSELVSHLKADATRAEALSTQVKNAWATLTACAPAAA